MPPGNNNDLTLEEIAKQRRREAKLQAAGVSPAPQSFGRFDTPQGSSAGSPGASAGSFGAGTLGNLAGASDNAPASLKAAMQASRNAPARSNPDSFDKWYFEPQSDEDGDAWLMTYLDTITLLLVFLLVMLMMAGKGDGINVREGITLGNLGIFNRERAVPTPAGSAMPIPTPTGGSVPIPLQPSADKGPLKDPTEGLELGDLGKDIDVVVNEKSVSFRINSEILFSSGQAELSREGLSVLQKLVNVVKKSKHNITIEGHTDSVPIRGGRFPSNWELSSSRAGSVVRYFEANGIASNRLRAIGYADTRPLVPNDTAENRAKNRRVELMMETVE